jgi:rhomboid protease GluP
MIKLTSKKAHITHLIIIINIVFFVVENLSGGSKNLENLERLGALIPQQVFAGEWWRLLSANFLHYDWIHLLSNMISLYFVGSVVELAFNKFFYTVIYLLSGIGSMFSFSILTIIEKENFMLIGSSAAIMGLVGTMLAIALNVWWQEKDKTSAKYLRLIILIIGIQFIVDFLLPQVSFFSHLFGLIWGFILGAIAQIFIRPKRLKSKRIQK